MCPGRRGEDKSAARSGIECSAITGLGQPRSFGAPRQIAWALCKKQSRPKYGAAIGNTGEDGLQAHCRLLRCGSMLEVDGEKRTVR
jgi:hypothetical protein